VRPICAWCEYACFSIKKKCFIRETCRVVVRRLLLYSYRVDEPKKHKIRNRIWLSEHTNRLNEQEKRISCSKLAFGVAATLYFRSLSARINRISEISPKSPNQYKLAQETREKSRLWDDPVSHGYSVVFIRKLTANQSTSSYNLSEKE